MHNDMFPVNSRLPSPTPVVSVLRLSSPPASPRVRHEHTVQPRLQHPHHIQHEQPHSSPPIRPESAAQSVSSRNQPTHTTPPSRLTSRRTTPSLSCSDGNRNSLTLRQRLPPAPFRQGFTPGPKPRAADYEDGVEKMLLNAMHEYSCLILTTDTFPDEMKQTQWAETTWRTACEVGMQYECSVNMIWLVSLSCYVVML
jgi:hypothetical protein